MNYILKGTLNALAWEDCIESLPNVIVKIYDVKDRANLDDLLIKGKKSILVLDSEEMQHEKEKHLLGEGLTNINGNFEIGLDTEKYHGGAFEIAIYCASVPGQKNGTDHHKSIEFVVATLLPTWEVTQGIMISHWNYELPFGFWRYILSLFDVWVIYGKVVSSRNPKIPIIGVEVTAHDADWISENHLGTSYTDKSGHFRIYYTSHDFNRTSLATGGVNISITDVYSGPDVYFTVKTSAGILLIDETKVDGRKPERSNIGNCHCMTMSIREGQGVEIKGMDSTWTGIGAAFAIPSGDEMNDFDPNGYAGIMKYAITGNVRLTGRKMHKVGPHPLEYRFLISKSTGVNGAPALPKSRFNLIVGRDPGLFVETKIGQMWKFSPTFKIVNIYVKQVDIDKDGWFDVSRAVERTFRDDESLHIAELADPNLWRWVDFDGMMAINTKMLTVARDIPLSELKAGNDISSSERIPIEKLFTPLNI